MGMFQWTIRSDPRFLTHQLRRSFLGCRQSIQLETQMTSVERVREYCVLDQEPPARLSSPPHPDILPNTHNHQQILFRLSTLVDADSRSSHKIPRLLLTLCVATSIRSATTRMPNSGMLSNKFVHRSPSRLPHPLVNAAEEEQDLVHRRNDSERRQCVSRKTDEVIQRAHSS